MSKTIKQIAAELGVSKQAVLKCIDNLGLRSTLTKNGNYFLVGDSQEKAIKQAFAARQTDNQNDNQNDNKTPTELTTVIAVLQTTIDTLQGQLAAKDEQIRAQQEQIVALQAELERERQHARNQSDKLAVLADQAQQLHAADKKTLAIEEKQTEHKRHWWQRKQ